MSHRFPRAAFLCLGRLFFRLVKPTLCIIIVCAAFRAVFGGESSLTQTYQPLDGLGSGEIVIAPVMCHDWYSHSGFPTAITLIGAKNVPPTNAPQAIGNINLAFEAGIKLSYAEDTGGRMTITIDFQTLQVPRGREELQLVAVTLECLRLVVGERLDQMSIRASLKSSGQEHLRQLLEEFIKHPKKKPFPWRERKA